MQSELVRATGAVMNFIGVLNEELIKAGGHPAMIYFAQANHARPMMALLANTIVESKLWKIPRSLILKEVAESQPDLKYLEYDQKWSWGTYSHLASELTTFRFVREDCHTEEYDDSTISGIPSELAEQVRNSNDSEKVCVVTWEGKLYVVTNWEERVYIHLAPAEYFDLEN